MRFKPRGKGQKAERAVRAEIDELVEAYHTADAFFGEKGGIIQQVIGGYDVRDSAADEPFRYVAPVEGVL